jgi:hypothetical protein
LRVSDGIVALLQVIAARAPERLTLALYSRRVWFAARQICSAAAFFA